MKMVKATLNGEFKMFLPQHRAERPDWYSDKGWEKPRLSHMSKRIGKGDVVYYVGAELGEMAALCQIWGAEVVLFEPNSSAWPCIKAIWDANKLEKPLACYAGFASNVHQPEPPHPDEARPKDWVIQKDGFPKYAQGKIVLAHGFSELYQEADGLPQYRIDNLVDEGLKPPTVITFDCEGSDWEVLKGAEKTLETYKPKIWASWHPEFMFHQFGEYLGDARNWVKDKGYKEELLDYQHEVHMYYESNS